MNIKLNIPDDFFLGEERCGYYVTPEMKKVWAVELDLIAEFARVCEKHHITWYASDGTLLGAARHKGFIPWDDDVDLIMMREDYDKLCSVASKEFRYPYFFDTIYDDVKRMIAHAKLYNEDTTMIDVFTRDYLDWGAKHINYSQGIHIDIFIAENIPDDEREFSKMYKKARFLHTMSHYLYRASEDIYYLSPSRATRLAKSLVYFTLKFTGLYGTELFSYKSYFHKYIDMIKSCTDSDSKRVANFAFIDRVQRNMWQRRDFYPQIQLPFEMLTLPVPSGYDNILTHTYGNWHEFEITHHHGTFFDTEKSYKEYLPRKQ